MLISAIITTYNRAHIIVDAIESVFSQTQPVSELIVIDDGSVDETEHVVKLCFSKAKIPCRYIKKENGGMASSLNRGIDEAGGTWIAFLDDDDLWSPDHIERCFEIAKTYPEIGCIAGLRDEKGQLQVIPQKMLPRLNKLDDNGRILIKRCEPLTGPFFTPVVGTSVLRKELFKEIRFSTEVGARLDIHFFWKISQITDIAIDLQTHGTGRQFEISYLSTTDDAPQEEKNRIKLKRNHDEILLYKSILKDPSLTISREFDTLLKESLIGRPYLLRNMGKFDEAKTALKSCIGRCSITLIIKELLLILTKTKSS